MRPGRRDEFPIGSPNSSFQALSEGRSRAPWASDRPGSANFSRLQTYGSHVESALEDTP